MISGGFMSPPHFSATFLNHLEQTGSVGPNYLTGASKIAWFGLSSGIYIKLEYLTIKIK